MPGNIILFSSLILLTTYYRRREPVAADIGSRAIMPRGALEVMAVK